MGASTRPFSAAQDRRTGGVSAELSLGRATTGSGQALPPPRPPAAPRARLPSLLCCLPKAPLSSPRAGRQPRLQHVHASHHAQQPPRQRRLAALQRRQPRSELATGAAAHGGSAVLCAGEGEGERGGCLPALRCQRPVSWRRRDRVAGGGRGEMGAAFVEPRSGLGDKARYPSGAVVRAKEDEGRSGAKEQEA